MSAVIRISLYVDTNNLIVSQRLPCQWRGHQLVGNCDEEAWETEIHHLALQTKPPSSIQSFSHSLGLTSLSPVKLQTIKTTLKSNSSSNGAWAETHLLTTDWNCISNYLWMCFGSVWKNVILSSFFFCCLDLLTSIWMLCGFAKRWFDLAVWTRRLISLSPCYNSSDRPVRPRSIRLSWSVLTGTNQACVTHGHVNTHCVFLGLLMLLTLIPSKSFQCMRWAYYCSLNRGT